VELTNTYRLDVSVAQAWAVLADLPQVAACLPGAMPTDAGPAGAGPAGAGPAGAGPAEVSAAGASPVQAGPGRCETGAPGDGVLRLTVDPGRYQVQARVAEADGTAHRIVITAEGTPGLAAVRVAAALRPWGTGAELSVLTGLTLSGRLAGLGPGVVVAVASRLMGRFAANLESAGAEVTLAPEPAVPVPAVSVPAASVPAAPAAAARPARRREPPGRRLVPGAVAAGAAGAAAGLVLVARRLAAARR